VRRLARHPAAIGAVTVLVTLVAVAVAYDANRGVPLAPAYRITLEAPSAANLVAGNEVRIGGARVGRVDAIGLRRRAGRDLAALALELDPEVAELPRDSTFVIRARSALGLKYVEITPGRAGTGWAEGATVPASAARPAPVELDEVLSTFDARTRRNAQRTLRGAGDGFAGRGEGLGAAIGAFAPLLRDVVPVARNLAAPETRLRELIDALDATATEVAPVAEAQAGLVRNLDATLAALRAELPALQAGISETRPALEALIRDLPGQRPFLRNATALMRELRPGTAALRGAAPDLAGALTAGTPALRRAPAFNARLASLLEELRAFAADPLVPRGLRRLADTVRALEPTLRTLTPAQARCNYVTLFFRNVASHLSEGDGTGTWQRFIIIATPDGPNDEGGPASAPANGPGRDNHLHTNPYPNTAAPGQPRECEAGNEPYLAGRTVIGNVPGTQPARTEATRP